MSFEYEIGPANDLTAVWDPDSTRLAHVSVTEGRIEIVLRDTDHEWVKRALDVVAAGHPDHPVIVIACPEEGEGPT